MYFVHNQYLALRLKKFGCNRWLPQMQHQLLHHIKFVIQTNALKPALAGMNPKSFQ
jgi:hypothetical protein